MQCDLQCVGKKQKNKVFLASCVNQTLVQRKLFLHKGRHNYSMEDNGNPGSCTRAHHPGRLIQTSPHLSPIHPSKAKLDTHIHTHTHTHTHTLTLTLSDSHTH